MTEPSPSVPPPGRWQLATVVEIRPETARAKTFRLARPEPGPWLAGQHFIVRLTAPDGYRASRSYSAASPPDGSGHLELTVERLPDGEVSSFLHDEVVVGDRIEIRGPIGGWFVWPGDTPALLVGGGSGVVPLMAMLRLARRTGRSDLIRLVVSVRRPEELYYAAEIVGPETSVLYTRDGPADGLRPAGRITAADLPGRCHLARPDLTAYVCGSSGFADTVTDLLTGTGLPASAIRVERFGPTR